MPKTLRLPHSDLHAGNAGIASRPIYRPNPACFRVKCPVTVPFNSAGQQQRRDTAFGTTPTSRALIAEVTDG